MHVIRLLPGFRRVWRLHCWFQLQSTSRNFQSSIWFEYLGMKENRHIVKANKGVSIIGYTQMDLGIAKCHSNLLQEEKILNGINKNNQ